MKRRVAPVSLPVLTSFAAGIILALTGCGSNGSGAQSTTSTSGSSSTTSSGGLTLASTTTSLDSSVPSSAAALISQVVSAVDAKPLGSSLSIPSDGTGFSTPVFAVDQNGNLLLAALSSSQSATTQFSATSTAETLAVTALGVSGLTTSQLISSVEAAPSFSTFVSDVQTALSQGASPTTSQSVAQDLATVLSQTVTGAYQQSPVKPFAVNPRTVLPTETVTPPLPFPILGAPIASLPTVDSVYVASVNGIPSANVGSLNVINTLPIAFAVSSADTSGNTLSSAQTLPAYTVASSVLSNLYSNLTQNGSVTTSTAPTPATIAGNGQDFVVKVDTTPTGVQNLDNAVADALQFALSQAFDLYGTKTPGLSACTQTAAQAIVQLMITTLTTTIGSATATPAQLGQAMVTALTPQVITGAIQSVIKCTGSSATSIASSAVIQTAITTMKEFLNPYWETIQLAYTWGSTIYAATIPITELAATWYYWDTSVNVNVCETNGQLNPCGQNFSITTPIQFSSSSSTGGVCSQDTVSINLTQFSMTVGQEPNGSYFLAGNEFSVLSATANAVATVTSYDVVKNGLSSCGTTPNVTTYNYVYDLSNVHTTTASGVTGVTEIDLTSGGNNSNFIDIYPEFNYYSCPSGTQNKLCMQAGFNMGGTPAPWASGSWYFSGNGDSLTAVSQ